MLYMKPTLVYINPDYYTQVDDTVLRYLTTDFKVVWIYLYEQFNAGSMRYGEKYVNEYGDKYGITTHVFYIKHKGRNPKSYLFYKDIANLINSYNPAVIYHCIRNPYWGLAIKTTIKCNNVVMGIHDAQAHSYSLSVTSILDRLFRDFILKCQNNFVTFSPNQHDLFFANYQKQSAMVGMSCKDFGSSSLSAPTIEEKVKFLFFGSINLYKGLDLLIAAIEQLYSEGHSNMLLTIAGKGNFWEECKKLIKTDALYKLQVRFIENSEIPDLMSTNHFLVLPYRNATQSGPLVAAVAYELPIIAPDYGCFRETYNDSSAILYNAGNLKDALLRACTMSQNEYYKMKYECSIIKEANSEERIADNYIKYFKSLI